MNEKSDQILLNNDNLRKNIKFLYILQIKMTFYKVIDLFLIFK